MKDVEDSRYCAICTPLGKDCLSKLEMSCDWNEEDANTKKENQEQPEANPSLFIMPIQALKPPKPYITKYLDNMSSDPPIIYIPKEKQRCNIIVAQQEHNTTSCKNLEQDPLEDID